MKQFDSHKIYAWMWALSITLLAGCRPSVPSSYIEVEYPAAVTPDNDGATIPPNIAPLNFRILEEGNEYLTCARSAKGGQLTVSGRDACFDQGDWHALAEQTRGDSLYIDIYVKDGTGWKRFAAQRYFVAEESIDPYITYRLIRPSYVTYEELTINERSTESFDERVIYENMRLEDSSQGQCINCHMPRNWNRDAQSQFHVRQALGGTIFIDGNKAAKVNLKTDSTMSAGVYPAWHPTQNLIAYSVNETGQVFHTLDVQKVEVIDYASDLILYDAENNSIQSIDRTRCDFESFPAWSPDGNTLYYISAHYYQRAEDIDADLDNNYDQLHYNIYARDFDQKTRKFGPRRLVFDAESRGKSASVPRVSPDGRYLLFTLADYGQFHIWHKSADLWVLPLSPRPVHCNSAATIPPSPDSSTCFLYPQELTPLNSSEAESYHTWSSNGRWILFSSRRDDGNYTRLYISYFDNGGRAHKPFRLPQRSADADDLLLRSYNAAEFLVRQVKATPKQIAATIRGDASNASYTGSALLRQEPDCTAVTINTDAAARRGESVGY
ncbi:MAG: hypothetical protein K6F94_07095 [Bacteroidaceae bacterium]|nr:hypothetical protein [Bacteroidaceae bacterium]